MLELPRADRGAEGQVKPEPARERCEECAVYVGGAYRHSIECSRDTRTPEEKFEYYRARIQQLIEHAERYQRAIDHWSEQVTLWQGKFRIVKHENNTLRRKLERRDR